MKIYQLIAVLLIVTLGPLSAEAAAPTAPDPSLAAAWWSYFEPKEPLDSAALSERVAAIDTLLADLMIQPANTVQPNYTSIAKQIINDLKIFNKLKDEPLPASKLDNAGSA